MGCFDWSIDRACEVGNPYTLPEDMRYHLIFLRFCNKVTKIMSGNNSSSLGIPADSERVLLMNLLEEELNTLEAESNEKLSRKLPLPNTPWTSLNIFSLTIQKLMSFAYSNIVSTCGHSIFLIRHTSNTGELAF